METELYRNIRALREVVSSLSRRISDTYWTGGYDDQDPRTADAEHLFQLMTAVDQATRELAAAEFLAEKLPELE